MRCIICKKDFNECEFVDEHVFPESLGGGFKLKGYLCKTCNHALGTKVDSLLVDHHLIKLSRFTNKIPNKDGVVPNPFGSGTDKKDPDKKILWSPDKKGNMSKPHLYPFISCEKRDDGAFDIIIDADESYDDQIILMVQKCLKRKGKNISIAELEKQILPALQHGSKHVTINYQYKINFNDEIPCFIKIAYEMASYWLGTGYLEDMEGEKLRTFLLCMTNGMSVEESLSKNKINVSVDFLSDNTRNFEFWRGHKCHIVVLFKEQNKIFCYIKVLEVFEGTITVSENPNLYPNFENGCMMLDYKTKKYSKYSNTDISEKETF